LSGAPRVVVLAGDGIGPEVMDAALRVLGRLGDFDFRHELIGGASIDAHGVAVTDEVVEACRESDAILFGAAGGPRWEGGGPRAEEGLMRLRHDLDLFANLRPVRPHPRVLAASPLRRELLDRVDLTIVRELAGGIYFGERGRRDDGAVFDTCVYTPGEVERVLRVAFGLADRGVTSVDKSNVLDTSRLWRSVAERLHEEEFAEVPLRHLLVDNAAMQLVAAPADFDVLVTENMFGDILSDLAAVLSGSIGMLPSASLGADDATGLFEPIHGSAPDIAGQGKANPSAMLLSAALMLRLKLGMEREAEAIESAVSATLDDGIFGPDLGGSAGTEEITSAVESRLPD
jgi:3-isopropylmalate dehydrogenase